MKRGIVLTIAVIILAVVVWAAFKGLPFLPRSLRPADPAAVREEPTAIAERGKPIVTAIYEFQNRHGIWPGSMNEIVPEYVSPEDAHGWGYAWHLEGWWHLTNYTGYPEWAVRYERRRDKEGWQLTDGIDGVDLGVDQPRPEPVRLADEEVLKNLGELMRRRIAAEPKRMIHYQGWISWLYRHKHYIDAREVCVRCLGVWPDHWWPTVMLSTIDARLGAFDEAEERLVRFTDKRAEFNYSFLLVQFYLEEGKEEKAFETLKAAIRLPIRDLDDAPYELYSADQPLGIMAHRGLWKASLLAYRAKCYDLALAVCDRWARFQKEELRTADASYYTIRAACYVAQGEFDKARSLVTEMLEMRRRGRQLGDNVDGLLSAIDRRDTNFVYETDEGPLKLLLDYK